MLTLNICEYFFVFKYIIGNTDLEIVNDVKSETSIRHAHTFYLGEDVLREGLTLQSV